jgi:hypothetical protein
MSQDNDVKLDEAVQPEQDTQEEATLPDEAETDEAVAAEADEGDESESEYEIVEQSSEPSQDTDKKKANARLAYEARKQRREVRKLKEKLERLKRGEIPDDAKEALKVSNELPEQPKFEDYLGDQALANYDYDTAKAQAAFQAAQNKWLLDVQTAQATNSVKEGQARQQYIQQQEQQLKVREDYEKAVEEMRIPDFDKSEQALIETASGFLGNADAAKSLPYEIAAVFGEDKNQAVAVVQYLGKNPNELQRLLSIRDPSRQIAELTKLGYSKLLVTKRTKKPKPEADEALTGGQQTGTSNDIARLKKALEKGGSEYRKAKREIEAKTGKRISGFDFW